MSTCAAATGNAAAVCLSKKYSAGADSNRQSFKEALEHWNSGMTFGDAKPYLDLAAGLRAQYANGDGAAAFYLFLARFYRIYGAPGPAIMYQLMGLWGDMLTSTDEGSQTTKEYYVKLAGLLKGHYQKPSCCRRFAVPGLVCTCAVANCAAHCACFGA